MSKAEHFIHKHQHVLEAVPQRSAFQGDDLYQELLGQVLGAYVRLSDAETVRLAAICRDENQKPHRQEFAADLLSRNALPVALRSAVQYAARFGGLLEAWDAAVYNLAKHLPKAKSGWNPTHNGIRWLTWVGLKLEAEMPKEATRLVDEKIGSGAPAAIAAARERLLYGEGNDYALRDEWQWGNWSENHYPYRSQHQGRHLPQGRKNQLVKRGHHRVTQAYLLKNLPATTRDLNGKVPLGWNGQQLIALPLAFEPWTKEINMRPSYLPITGHWIAAAVRANARALLARPKLSERTRSTASKLLHVKEEWVARHARAQKLDALVGEEQDERLSDIIPATVTEAKVFEVPLAHVDTTRAITAFKRYGTQHATTLMKLPVRQLLPVHARRQRERGERAAYRSFLTRYGIQDEVQAARAALYAAHLVGCSEKPLNDIRKELHGVQAALRGPSPTPQKQMGAALAKALAGTPLHVANQSDRALARQLRTAFPGLKLNFPLVVMIAWQRKIARHGRADRTFIQACQKAGVRVKEAEQALAQLKSAPLTARNGQRIRVKTADVYQRPWQLELERHARLIGQRADVATPTALQLERVIQAAEATTSDAGISDLEWLQALDVARTTQPQAKLARTVADGLARVSSELEEAATDLNLPLALRALLEAEELLDLHEIVQTPEAWWAQAYHHCRQPDQRFSTLSRRYRRFRGRHLHIPARHPSAGVLLHH